MRAAAQCLTSATTSCVTCGTHPQSEEGECHTAAAAASMPDGPFIGLELEPAFEVSKENSKEVLHSSSSKLSSSSA
jgi:hypothetical protein